MKRHLFNAAALLTPLLYLILAAGASAPARGQATQPAAGDRADVELIRNGGFEEAFSSKGVAVKWADNSAWAPVEVRYGDEILHPHGGRHAQRIECTSFKSGAVQFVQDGLSVSKGAIYHVSLWMEEKVDAPVEVLLRKSGAPYTTYISHVFHVSSDGAVCTFEGVCEENDPQALFIVRFGSTGTLVIDDVSCRQVGTAVAGIRLDPPNSVIPATFFGMHLHRSRETTAWPEVPFGALRLWDSGVSWPQLEPERGKWDFARLDSYLDLARAHNVEVLLPLGLTPTWAAARPNEKSAYSKSEEGRGMGWASEPRDLEDWDRYVRMLATHCKDRVHDYEIWNEPNAAGFFTGSPDQLVELTRRAARVLKDVDPANRIVSPSVVGDVAYLDNFLGKRGAAPAGIIGYHFYVWPDPPEKMLPQIRRVKATLKERKLDDRPLWDTEAGWDIEAKVAPPPATAYVGRRPLEMKEAASYIARAYILQWAAGVDRYYFYAWDDGLMGLVERDGTLKPPARAYATVYGWLVGTQMESAAADEFGTWTVRLAREGGRRVVIMWNDQEEIGFTPPAEWHVSRVSDLGGGQRKLLLGETIRIGASPVMLDH